MKEDLIDQTNGNGPNKRHKKEFALSSLSVDNKTTVFVITAIILFAGIFSYINVPKESFPEVIIPQIYIGTAYPGNSPTDIEKLITRPLEKEINTITGVDVITSTSIQGYSAIDVKFTFDVEPDERSGAGIILSAPVPFLFPNW